MNCLGRSSAIALQAPQTTSPSSNVTDKTTRSRIVVRNNDTSCGLGSTLYKLYYHQQDGCNLGNTSCFRCHESSSSFLSTDYQHRHLQECAHCGFDVCQDCCSSSTKITLYSALFYLISKNHCLCNECYHALRCLD